MRLIRIIPFISLILFTVISKAETFEMDMLETEDVRMLYFDPVQTYLVPHMSRSFHNSLAFQKSKFEWQPWDKSTVILTDLSDYGNAGAGVSPGNGVTVYIAPTSRTFETSPGAERTFMLMNHELVHIATMDGWNQQDARWRKFFRGKPRQSDQHPESIFYNYLAVPRMSSPRWYLEGTAVFLETWMSGGVGRAQGAYDEMVFRSMVRDDAYFYSNLGIVSEGVSIDFQVGVNAYLYGTRFISYLSFVYSPDQIIEWMKRDEGSERYYTKQFEQVFGLSLESAWQDWIDWEKEFQQKNLVKVHETPLTAGKRLRDEALGSTSRAFLTEDEKTLIGAFRYPGVVAHIGTIDVDTGELKRITDIKGPRSFTVTSPAYDSANNRLFYTADNKSYRDLMSVNLASGEEELLIRDARIGDIVFNEIDRSLWGLRHLNGYVSLVRIPHPYDDWNELHTWSYGEVPYEMDISPDGGLLSTSKAEIDGTQHLQVYKTEELLAGKIEPVAQFDFGPTVPEGFVFSPDGKYLFGSSFYTGVSNIFRFEWATGELEAVSNAETGFFKPIPRSDGTLIVFEYTGQGFIPAVIDPVVLDDLSAITFLGNEIVKKHPVVKDWSVIKSFRSTPENPVAGESKYRPAKELALHSAYPVLEGYRDDTAFGWHFNYSDPAQFHKFELTASYTLDSNAESDERLHFNAQYSSLNWHFQYWHNDADFYDLFGPTEYSRKGDALLIGYEKALIYDTPRELMLTADLEYFTGLDTLPSNQNVSTFQFEDILSAEIALIYKHTLKSLGAVDHEKGFEWDLVLKSDHAEGESTQKLRAGFDAGFALPWKHSSIWLYTDIGFADGDRLNPLTSYYFGGYGNNYVDNSEIKRYREYYSMPGFEIDQVSAKTFGKAVLEWNLPPKRFREVGTPGLFLSWLRPALFVGSLWADPDGRNDRRVSTTGVQVDLHFTLAHRLPMTLSIGYAVGFESGQDNETEWMLSLKVL
ncbi:MAG TPA: hypothetical protein QF517_03415 [Pseudomonadales bacterium]|jgi:hypothetical protein|nr:hypothetical protein [Gammaproteobacteria bacterium]MDP6025804.1 hypothetical protein [Pseudomonadales bacterium]MDP6314919.1 hypothetical protein [Pseudomonadales bacterium]MDP7314797.1 hypothetical protein [Pseudomonadales bacterium]HJL60980.1 hypothetical protein [Pseudomonadales bacterium]|tara:strand:+ start:8153 stop:11092 length:2940 start_codon:yes stop_codon:yes gene_type:complete